MWFATTHNIPEDGCGMKPQNRPIGVGKDVGQPIGTVIVARQEDDLAKYEHAVAQVHLDVSTNIPPEEGGGEGGTR